MRFEIHRGTGLLVDADNLRETIRWIRTHNVAMQQFSDEEVESQLWVELVSKTGGSSSAHFTAIEGQMIGALAGFWIVDNAHKFGHPRCGASHIVNFFIRPGRAPALNVAK